jgi:hypothetical protein
VLLYQLTIVAVLVAVRILRPKWLFAACLAWTIFTAVNLSWPPLIILQLVVIWTTFGLLSGSGTPPAGNAPQRIAPGNGKLPEASPDRAATLAPPDEKTGPFTRALSKVNDLNARANSHLDRLQEIQAATTATDLKCGTERYRTELHLERAEREFQRLRRAQADPAWKAAYDRAYAQVSATLARNPEDPTFRRDAPARVECVDLSLPVRHQDSEIADSIERRYGEIADLHAAFLTELLKRFRRTPGLRDIFEKEVTEAGDEELLLRISLFERGQEWRSRTALAAARLPPAEAASGPGPRPATRTEPVVQAELAAQVDPIAPAEPAKEAEPAVQVEPVAQAGSVMPAERLIAPSTRAALGTLLASISREASPGVPEEKGFFPEVTDTVGEIAVIPPPPDPRQKIKEDAVARGIPLLAHFTRARNLESILRHGLCSIATTRELGIKAHANDAIRLDGHPGAISLSIAFPNYRMFYKYRCSEPDEDWTVLLIDPAVLWTGDCAFCQRNAADHRIRQKAVQDLMHADAFRSMFEEIDGVASREAQGLLSYDPTDPQAEVLVFGTIGSEAIKGVLFDDPSVMKAFSHLRDNLDWDWYGKGEGPFASRSFVRKVRH